jgi:hypothetical protein
MSRTQKQLSNCLQKAETSVDLIIFDGVQCEVRCYTVTVCFTVARYEPGTRTTLSWSVIVYTNIYPTQYVHIRTRCETGQISFFYPFLKLVQTHLIFSDNVHQGSMVSGLN